MLRQRDRIQRILTETIITLCNNGLDFSVELCVEGLLGITLDHHDIILVNIKELVSLKNQTNNNAVHHTDAAPCASVVREVEVSEGSGVRERNQTEDPKEKSNNETVVYVDRMSIDTNTVNDNFENISHQVEPLEEPQSKVARYDENVIQQVECSPVARNDIPTSFEQIPVATSGAPALVKEEPLQTNITPPEPQEQLTTTHPSAVMSTSCSLPLHHDRHTNSTRQVKTPSQQSHKPPVVAPVSQPPVAMHQPPATFYDSDLTTQLQHAPIMSRLLIGAQGASLDVMSQSHMTAGTITANNGSNDIFDYMTAGAFGNAGLASHTETQLSTVLSHNAIREVKLFSCPQCSFTSKRKFNVERHVLRLHYVRCDKCHQFFRSELDLKSYHLPHCHQDSSTATATSAVLADMSSLADAHQSGGIAHPVEHAGKSRSSEHAGISFPLEAVSIAHLAEVIGASRSNTTVHHSSEPKSAVQSVEHSGNAKSPEHVGKSKSHQMEHTDVLRPAENAVGHTAKDTRLSPMVEHSITSHMAEHTGMSHMAEHTGTLHMAEHSSLHHSVIDHGSTRTAPEHMNLHMPHHGAEHAGMALSAAEHMVNVSHQTTEHLGMTPAASGQTSEHSGVDHSGRFYNLADRVSHP